MSNTKDEIVQAAADAGYVEQDVSGMTKRQILDLLYGEVSE